jgi:ATP-dependent DNA ligase
MSNSLPFVQPGEYIRPPSAQLRSVPNGAPESVLVEIWREVGTCLGGPKYDGWRFQIHKLGAVVKLFSRTGKDWAAEFPSIVQMIRTQVGDDQAILDTELVGFDQYGHHLEPSKLRYAFLYRCYLLDGLYLNRRNLTPLPTQERVSFIKEYLDEAFQGIFTPAEYTTIASQEDLIRLYQECRERREEGFDGMIIRPLDVPYQANIFKLKPEDSIDVVVVGAYWNEERTVSSLLLAVPSHEHNCWVPIAKVKRASTDWDTVWKACQPFLLNKRPEKLEDPPSPPDVWIAPEVVVAVTMTDLHPGKGYLVRAEYTRNCVLREDKGPEEATPFEQVLQMADLTQRIKMTSEKSKQLSLFEDHESFVGEYGLDEKEIKKFGETTLFEQTLSMEDLTLRTEIPSERLIQGQLSLFEQ